MTSQWFISKTVRQATAMRKHVEKLLNHQRDILSPQAVEAVRTALADIHKAVAENGEPERLEKQMEAAGAPWTPGRIPDWKDQ